MNLDPHMEDKILKPKKRKSYLAVVVVAIAVLLLGSLALYIRNAGVSADTLTPPVPAEPSSITPPTPDEPVGETPPVPADPTKPGQFTFASGWTMVYGKAFSGYSLNKLEDAGIYLYSYNDPDYPTTSWTIFPGTVSGKKISLNYRTPLGYYAYNPTTKPIVVTLDKKTVTTATKTSSSSFGRGWHLMYWDGAALTKDQLFSKIKITYSDKSQLSGTQAVASDKHTASLKVYVVTNQNTTGLAKSVKELTGTDSATTVSKLPKNSYYWIYLRRTKSRAESLVYGTITPTPTATATSSDIVPPVPTVPSVTSTTAQ